MARKPRTKISTTTERSEALAAVAKDIIADHMRLLADAKFEFLMKTRQNDDTGKTVLPRVGETMGKVSKAGAIDRLLHHYDFRVMVNGNWWAELNDKQKRALTFHLLCHCEMAGGKPLMNKHDFEGFVTELEHFGAWVKELAQIRSQLLQQPLQFEEREGAVPTAGAAR